jgi:molybdopterin/thiamine biosynthesis adenylyltransferase
LALEVWAVYFTIATAGVGTIGIVDFDTIEIHNLHRQILYTEDQVGLSKLKLPKRLCINESFD